jgi:TorA maturation chaperone TorD
VSTSSSITHVEADTLLARQRARLYRVLARCYAAEPDETLGVALAEPAMRALMAAFSPSTDTTAFGPLPPAQCEALAVEYTRLFIGPGPAVPPYESVHRSESGNAGRYWGDATVTFNRLIAGLGLQFSDGFHGMPDHIAAECELMALLLEGECEGRERGDAATAEGCADGQVHLLGEHLRHWARPLAARLGAEARTPFFRALATLTDEFFADE